MGLIGRLVEKTQNNLIDGVFRDAIGDEVPEMVDFGPRLAPPSRSGIRRFYAPGAGSRLRGQKQVVTGLVLTPTRLLMCDVAVGGLGSTRKFKPAKGSSLEEWTREGLSVHVVEPGKKDAIYNPMAVVVEFVSDDNYASVFCTLMKDQWLAKVG